MLLQSTSLEKYYGKRPVVKKVSIEVNRGEIVGLLGPNGAGKTTTFYMLVGFIRPDAGKVFLGEDEITSLPMFRRAQKGISYLPQEASIFRKLSVEDNIKAILEMTSLSSHQRNEKLESLELNTTTKLNEFRESLYDKFYFTEKMFMMLLIKQ